MYVKIFENILDSSVWEEPHATVRVWLAMLCMADEDGVIQAIDSAIRKRAGGSKNKSKVTDKEWKEAINTLESPDLDSKDKDYGGRRIERIEGGWLVLNKRKYRDIRTRKQMQDAERQRRHRAKLVNEKRDLSQPSRPVTTTVSNTEAKTVADSKAEKEKGNSTVDEASSSTALIVPTNAKPILASDIANSLMEFMQHDLNKSERLAAQCTALFSYYCHKTRKRAGSTQFTVDRFNRLKRHIQQRGLSFCLYVCDGGVKHPHLNQDSGKNWELKSFFPLNDADRLEKLIGITKFDDEPTHPWLAKHPDLEG